MNKFYQLTSDQADIVRGKPYGKDNYIFPIEYKDNTFILNYEMKDILEEYIDVNTLNIIEA